MNTKRYKILEIPEKWVRTGNVETYTKRPVVSRRGSSRAHAGPHTKKVVK